MSVKQNVIALLEENRSKVISGQELANQLHVSRAAIWKAIKTLKEEGYNVVRSSLKDGQDFFTYEPDKWDIIVSNPPFSNKDKVLERLYSFEKPFAILLPLNSLQGKTRFKFFKQGIQLLSFDSRISFHKPDSMDSVIKGSPFATAYFCKDLLPRDLIVEELKFYEKSLVS